MDSTNLTCVVYVTAILQQVYYTINSLNWAFNNTTPFEASVFVADSDPGPVNITWDFGDGTSQSAMRTGTSAFLTCTTTTLISVHKNELYLF
jgi:hypothetical protein